MTIQRAAINCKRCYNLAYHVNFGDCMGSELKFGLSSEEIFTARNEAMKALENQVINCKVYGESSSSHAIEAQKMLDVCMDCDYSSPKIKELVTKLLKDKEK